MHIVLDLQACQSPASRRRGIGRYSLALAQAMATQPRGHQITVLLNAAMPESIEYLRGRFDGLLPQDRIHTWQGLAPAARINPANTFRMRASEMLRREALRQLKPDVVHIASLFEGMVEDVVATVPGGGMQVDAVTLYDLIPLVHADVYLSDPLHRSWYMEKLAHLRRAKVLLGISQFSCNEARDLLDVPPERLVDISGAADEIFVRLEDAGTFREEVMRRYGLEKPFIMYAGGFDARKNIGALIRAFALLPGLVRSTHQLAIVGDAPTKERDELLCLARNAGIADGELVFTGYVPDAELVKLYNLCDLYVFPSLQEGFGLPVLEAMSSGAPVIGSDTSSLPEVIGFEDALFDARSDTAIANKMVEALTDESFRARLREHGRSQCLKFSWRESARRAIQGFEAAYARQEKTKQKATRGQRAEQLATAFLPSPGGDTDPKPGSITIYADEDCDGVSADYPLVRFDRDRDRFERVIIELADDPYCAKTLRYAADGSVDVLLRDHRFGRPLRALLEASDAGRDLVVSLLYHAGGYHALRVAIEQGYSAEALGSLVGPQSLTWLGRTQVISDGLPRDGEPQEALAWRAAVKDAVTELTEVEGALEATDRDWTCVASALSRTSVPAGPKAQWLVDISHLFIYDAGTGIQRVVRHVLDELLATPPSGYRVEPICLGDDGVFRYARSYCQRRYFKDVALPPDEPVEFAKGDVYLGLDLIAHLIPAYIGVFRHLRNIGVRVNFVVYDILPLVRPDCFDPTGLVMLRRWYESVAEVADGVVCISKAVADEFEEWLHQARPERHRPLNIGWFHLGADLAGTTPAQVIADSPTVNLSELGDRPTLLMVGTVEPRKGHAQALSACELLWEKGIEVNLLVIGKPGWLVDDLLRRMAEHPQRGKRFFWFQKAGDDLLLAAYHRASALLMASEGEGFGLPLIEGAHHGLPLIARDLPVFKEIAGEHAHYFSGNSASDLAGALRSWLELSARNQAPRSIGMRWNTWAEATVQLVEVIRRGRWTYRWSAGPVRRFAAFDYRFQTQVGRLVRGRMMTSGIPGLLLYGPYVPVNAGRYMVNVYGGGTGNALLGASSRTGTKVHLHHPFTAAGTDTKTLLAQFELSLEVDVPDLEVRVWVDAEASIWLGEVEIAPVKASPAPVAAERHSVENGKI